MKFLTRLINHDSWQNYLPRTISAFLAMMDIKPSSQPPQGDVLRFFRTTVDKMGPGDRECCADAFLRMVSDSPPGEPKSW